VPPRCSDTPRYSSTSLSTAPAPPATSTLPLHDALPILRPHHRQARRPRLLGGHLSPPGGWLPVAVQLDVRPQATAPAGADPHGAGHGRPGAVPRADRHLQGDDPVPGAARLLERPTGAGRQEAAEREGL